MLLNENTTQQVKKRRRKKLNNVIKAICTISSKGRTEAPKQSH